jgi:hypothetical protein
VTSVDYSYVDLATPDYKVKVNVAATNSSCDHYLANFVIVTVPVGVLEQGKIAFSPPLLSDESPLTMAQYIKIFYKFNFRVGPKYNNEFMFSVLKGGRTADSNDRCINWQNMEARRNAIRNGTSSSYLQGSKIWMCTLVTEAFEKLLAEQVANGTGNGTVLTAQQIDNLLNPLRKVFPGRQILQSDYVYFYPDLNLRDSFGNGAYSNWKVGKSIGSYYKYYGGGPAKRCMHNGCDQNNVWRLHISGTASCFNEWEFVHGAYFAGQRSAKYVLAEMNYSINTAFLPCDDFRKKFILPP